jgi:hypothetical protein
VVAVETPHRRSPEARNRGPGGGSVKNMPLSWKHAGSGAILCKEGSVSMAIWRAMA